jgi:hypothetical protein
MMANTYRIFFRTHIQASKSLQKLHDCLKQLNVKHWAYDFQDFLLTMTSELSDFTYSARLAFGGLCLPFYQTRKYE